MSWGLRCKPSSQSFTVGVFSHRKMVAAADGSRVCRMFDLPKPKLEFNFFGSSSHLRSERFDYHGEIPRNILI